MVKVSAQREEKYYYNFRLFRGKEQEEMRETRNNFITLRTKEVIIMFPWFRMSNCLDETRSSSSNAK